MFHGTPYTILRALVPFVDDTPYILGEDLPERKRLQHLIPQRIHSLPDSIALIALAAVPTTIASLGVPETDVHVVVAFIVVGGMDGWEVDLVSHFELVDM
jgi:hypothetical protein